MEKKVSQLATHFKDHKFTPQRRIVLEVFLENKGGHLSADDVFNLTREKDKEIGLATIYRSLDLLEELRLINKFHFGDGRSRYELALTHKDEHHHHHLICRDCENIFEVKEDLLHQLEEVIEKENQFKIVDHRVQFYGYCASCQKKQK